jgi:hypothetical protein
MATRVIHIRDKKCTPDEVYIGRGSIFGNPFKLASGATRGSTLVKYRAYLSEKLRSDDEFRDAVLALKDKTLVCFCKPLPCHGDILAEYIDGFFEASKVLNHVRKILDVK